MKNLMKLALTTCMSVMTVMASAQVFQFQPPTGFMSSSQPQVIPDGDINGLSDSIVVNTDTAPFSKGFVVQVLLNIDNSPQLDAQGNPILLNGVPIVSTPNNGDFYATLSHGNAKAVLLNRVGLDAVNTSGYGDPGMHVILQDNVNPFSGTALNDIHTYRQNIPIDQQGKPLGTAATPSSWAPDGRSADPGAVSTSSPRDAKLSVLSGTDPNGLWTLFIADVQQGNEGVLTSWGLNFAAVPEPHQYAMIAGLALIGFALYRRFALKAA